MENTIWTLWVDGHRDLFMVTKQQKQKKGDRVMGYNQNSQEPSKMGWGTVSMRLFSVWSTHRPVPELSAEDTRLKFSFYFTMSTILCRAALSIKNLKLGRVTSQTLATCASGMATASLSKLLEINRLNYSNYKHNINKSHKNTLTRQLCSV